MSIDGKIALTNGESKWITSKYSRQDVQIFRAKNSAILSTSETILNDNPLLNIRYKDFNKNKLLNFPKKYFQHPTRVIIDSKNRVNDKHKIFSTLGKILLIRLKYEEKKWPKNVEQIIVPSYKNHINILSMLKILGDFQINNLLVEAGSTLSGVLLKMKLIDEIIIYIAPKILGNKAKSLFKFKNILQLSKCLKYDFKSIKKIGPDIRVILTPKYKKYN